MADNIDSNSFGFSIENTMEMGAGNQELLNNLFEPETSTSRPEDLQEIVKTIEDPAPAKTKAAPVKTVTDEEASPEKSITDFLLGGDEDEEEEEEPAAPAVPKPTTETPEEEVEEISKFGALAKDLFKLGVFTSEEDEDDVEINTPEEFLEKFEVEKKKGAIEVVNKFIGQFGEDYQQAFDAIFVKGVDPKQYFDTFNSIANFSDMDLSQEKNQMSVIKQALTDQGFEPEDIETELERLQNYGDLESVATKHHKVLVKKEAQKLQQMEQASERELQQKANIKNQYINNVQSILQERLKTKEFDGIPLNPKIASELQDFLLVDKYKTTSGETLTDFDRTILELKRPENHPMKVKVALLLKMLEKDPTLSTIQKTGVTKKSNDLFGEVARQVQKSSVKGSKSEKSDSWFL
jgi:hypothetical protein